MTMKWLNEKICEELDDACCYIKKANYFREKGDTRTGDVFRSMSDDELKHSEHLMNLAIAMSQKGESELPQDVVEYMMNCAIEKKHEVQYHMAVYRM